MVNCPNCGGRWVQRADEVAVGSVAARVCEGCRAVGWISGELPTGKSGKKCPGCARWTLTNLLPPEDAQEFRCCAHCGTTLFVPGVAPHARSS